MALRRAVPALVLVASVVAAVTAVTVAAAARPAAATADGTEVGIVGDSIPFAMEWYASAGALDPLAARRYWIDTLACRTTTAVTSCPRLPSISPATQVIADHAAAAPRVLVVALGANESPSSFAGGLRAVLAAARAVGVERVLWLTVVERGPDAARFAVINQLIREAAAEEPDLVVGEWGAAQAPHPAWSDGPDVHLSLVGARAMASFIADQVAPLLAGRCGPSVAGVGADPGPVVTRGADPGPSGRLTPVGPERLADTRSGAPVEAGKVLPVPVAGRPGVPADATGALVTVTAVDACAAGYLTAYDCGPLPWASNLDVDRGGTRAATTAVALAPDGALCVLTSVRSDVIVDLTGWIGPAGALGVRPSAPHRLLDTRDAGTRLAGGATLAVATGTSDAAVLNVTAVDAIAPGYVTVWAPGPTGCDGERPDTSNLNLAGSDAVANLVVTPTTAGSVCVFASAATHVVVDLLGAATPAAGTWSLAGPVRILDTRDGTGGAGPTAAGVPVAVHLAAPPGTAGAVVVVTADHPAAATYVTAYGGGRDGCGAPPWASNVNVVPGEAAANLAVVAVGASSTVCVVSDRPAGLILDLVGWVAQPATSDT